MSEDFDFAKAEQDLATGDFIYGNADEIAEALNSVLVAVGSFGPDYVQALVDEIDAAIPLMKEINQLHPRSLDEINEMEEHYFGTPEAEAASIDAMAEAVKIGQRWIQSFLHTHGLEQLSVFVPTVDRRAVRRWTFGKLSVLRAQGALDDNTQVAGTVGIEEDQPRSSPESPEWREDYR